MEKTQTPKLNLVILGPNLDAKMQKRGEMHVHSADCADVGKYRIPRGEIERVRACSRAAVVHYIYPPEQFEYAPSEWEEMGVYFAPCTDSLSCASKYAEAQARPVVTSIGRGQPCTADTSFQHCS